MAAATDFWENRLVDFLFRGQALTQPTNWYFSLFTVAPTDSTAGTEVSTSGTAYARVTYACSMANWSGTQGAATTVASSGTGGTISNNNPITFPAPTGSNWGNCVAFGIHDAVSAGNLCYFGALSQAKNVNAGDSAPTFPAATLTIQIDN